MSESLLGKKRNYSEDEEEHKKDNEKVSRKVIC